MEILEVIRWYLILDVAFIITSLFTLHFPSWRIAKEWAKEYLEVHQYPTSKYMISHTIAYTLVAFIAFPVIMPLLLISNKEAITGYTKSIIKGIKDE